MSDNCGPIKPKLRVPTPTCIDFLFDDVTYYPGGSSTVKVNEEWDHVLSEILNNSAQTPETRDMIVKHVVHLSRLVRKEIANQIIENWKKETEPNG